MPQFPSRTCIRRTLVLGACGIACTHVLTACSRSDPERELRAAFESMEEAIRERRTGDFMAQVAEDFVQPSTGLDRAGLRRLVAGTLLANPNIRLAVTVRELQIDGDRATVRLAVLATGGRGMLPERGQAWDVTTGWRRAGSRWQLYSGDWKGQL